jgi:hypothetical protein
MLRRGLVGWLGASLLACACADLSGLRDYSIGSNDPVSPEAAVDGATDAPASDGAAPDAATCSPSGCDSRDACAACDAAGEGDASARDASCALSFGYAPSNFSPDGYIAPDDATLIDCNTTYDSTAHAFTDWCPGRTAPEIIADVTQAGGPNIDVLAFGGLTVNAGVTLALTGKNAIVLAVYGDANVHGTIDADGEPEVSGNSAAGTSGPGGAYACSANAGGNAGTATSNSGGGGGGGSTAGGGGANDCPVVAVGGAAGAARPNVSLAPLYGGCPGGSSGPGGCTTGGGGAGGAVQLSAAGVLSVDGTITANGGAGGTSTCTEVIVGVTYYGGGGGGGAGGAILLEGSSVAVSGTVSVQGGKGGASGGGGAAYPSSTGMAGGPASCTGSGVAGGGGGGGYGYTKTNTGALPVRHCSTRTCDDAGCAD